MKKKSFSALSPVMPLGSLDLLACATLFKWGTCEQYFKGGPVNNCWHCRLLNPPLMWHHLHSQHGINCMHLWVTKQQLFCPFKIQTYSYPPCVNKSSLCVQSLLMSVSILAQANWFSITMFVSACSIQFYTWSSYFCTEAKAFANFLGNVCISRTIRVKLSLHSSYYFEWCLQMTVKS